MPRFNYANGWESDPEVMESDESFYENYPYGGGTESDEAVKYSRPFTHAFRMPPIPQPKGGGYFQRPLPGYATKKELSDGLARVGADIKRNSDGIQAVNARLTAMSAEMAKAVKSLGEAGKNIDNFKQMFLLTALMGGDKKVQLDPPTGKKAGESAAYGDEINLKDKSDSMDKLLPVLLMGGLGGGEGKAGGGLLDNPLMLVLLMDSMKK